MRKNKESFDMNKFNKRMKELEDYIEIIKDYHNCSEFVIGCDDCKASELMADSKFTTYCDFLRQHCEIIQERLEKAFKQL